jgi:hypothetical protein
MQGLSTKLNQMLNRAKKKKARRSLNVCIRDSMEDIEVYFGVWGRFVADSLEI